MRFQENGIKAPGTLASNTTEKSSFTTLVAAALVALVSADGIPDFVVPGRCAKVANQDKFDLRRYSGRWYQTQIIDNAYQPYTRCIHSNYDYSDSDYGFKVTTAGFSPTTSTRLQGKIYPQRTSLLPTCSLISLRYFSPPYEVVETDYDSYSCVYSCIDWNGYKSSSASSSPAPPQTSGPANDKCASVFRKNGVDFALFNEVAHTAECVYRA
ncbi:crustacyanin subunit A [Penaeus vannamei]|uniref:Crustacyanin subunit A n=1 Tax=Penaeus vannamei TaxID=6689 RepID=A0A423U529_PENVA|nr:crustacyanin subunit A [Penaeus vannamei]